MRETFAVSADFLQTVKVFPTNFISAILCANLPYNGLLLRGPNVCDAMKQNKIFFK